MQLPCHICGEYFTSKVTLKSHKKEHRKVFRCFDCNMVFLTSHRLLRHQKSQHSDKCRCWYACGFLCDTYLELTSHYETAHDDCSKPECPQCQKEFLVKACLMNHLEKCKDCPPDKRPAHVCGNCEGFFPNMETYNNHAKICLLSIKKKGSK